MARKVPLPLLTLCIQLHGRSFSLFFPSLSRNQPPVHPNHDIKFPSRPQGLGKFQGDINRTWKITTQRKAVLDPTSDTTRTPLFFFIGAWQLPRFRIPESLCSRLASDRVTGPAEPWPRGHSSAITPTLGRAVAQHQGQVPSMPAFPTPPSPPAGPSSHLPPPGRPPLHCLSQISS